MWVWADIDNWVAVDRCLDMKFPNLYLGPRCLFIASGYRRVSIECKLTAEMRIQHIASLGNLSLLDHIHHTSQALALIHWVSDECLRTGTKFYGLNRLLICRMLAAYLTSSWVIPKSRSETYLVCHKCLHDTSRPKSHPPR